MWRIEGMSGTDRNMAGLRAKFVIFDEGAFGNWICHGSRVQVALPGVRWIYAGVPNFMDSPFRQISSSKPVKGKEDEPWLGRGWSRHGGSTFVYNPLYWSEDARTDLIGSYQDVNDPLFITQVLGMWTEQMGASAFPPGCFSIHTKHYIARTLSPQDVAAQAWPKLLKGLRCEYQHYVMGFDWGYSPEPAVIIILGSDDQLNWYTVARLRFRDVLLPDQVRLIGAIGAVLKRRVRLLSSDHPPALQLIDDQLPWIPTTWSVPQGTTERQSVEHEPMLDERGKPIPVRNREFQSELVRDAMSFALLDAPYHFYLHLFEDHELIDEMTGTSAYRTTAGYMVYHSPNKTPGSKSDDDHNTDALRFGADAIYKLWDRGFQVEEPSVEGLGFVDTTEVVMPGQAVSYEDLQERLYGKDRWL